MMTVERFGGGASAVRVRFGRGDRVKAEPDALVTMSEHVQLGAELDGGLVAGILRRVFSGESILVQTLAAEAAGGDALLCPPEVGDCELIELTAGSDVLLQKVCCAC